MQLRKGSLPYRIRRWYNRNVLYLLMYAIIALAVWGTWTLLHKEDDTPPYIPPVDVSVITLPEEEYDPINTPYTETPYTETPNIEATIEEPVYSDLIILASILEAECWEGDWRMEATVIMNRLDLPVGHYMNPDGTLKGVIENGHFDGTNRKPYIEKDPSDKALAAAQEVLDGYRSFGSDILYFSNIETATDHKFIASVNWVIEQPNARSHSFGKDF